jgi:hypothetical protein
MEYIYKFDDLTYDTLQRIITSVVRRSCFFFFLLKVGFEPTSQATILFNQSQVRLQIWLFKLTGCSFFLKPDIVRDGLLLALFYVTARIPVATLTMEHRSGT